MTRNDVASSMQPIICHVIPAFTICSFKLINKHVFQYCHQNLIIQGEIGHPQYIQISVNTDNDKVIIPDEKDSEISILNQSDFTRIMSGAELSPESTQNT